MLAIPENAEAAPKSGLVTPSTTWWMRCETGSIWQRGVKDLIAWIVDGHFMKRRITSALGKLELRNPLNASALAHNLQQPRWLKDFFSQELPPLDQSQLDEQPEALVKP